MSLNVDNSWIVEAKLWRKSNIVRHKQGFPASKWLKIPRRKINISIDAIFYWLNLQITNSD